MPITGNGWELHVERLGIHVNGAKKRTYGKYKVYIDGQALVGLGGLMAESIGPGDNKVAGNRRRIEAGRYPLWTQFGRYRSIGYSENSSIAGDPPMPAIRLEGANKRVGILIHPAHPPKPYLSSVGCLNRTNPVTPTENINFWDSRSRTLAIIASLKGFDAGAFKYETMTRIKNASIVVDGEPMAVLTPSTPALLALVEPANLPISENAARKCARWLLENFGEKLKAAVGDKQYGVEHLCAIVC